MLFLPGPVVPEVITPQDSTPKKKAPPKKKKGECVLSRVLELNSTLLESLQLIILSVQHLF